MTVEKTSWNSGCPDFERLWSMRTPVLTEAEREVTTTAENTPHLIKQAMFAGYEEGRRAAAPGPAADSEGTRLARQIGELLLTAPGVIPELESDNWLARLAVWHVRTLIPTLRRLLVAGTITVGDVATGSHARAHGHQRPRTGRTD